MVDIFAVMLYNRHEVSEMINLTEKLKIAMLKLNLTQLQLAERTEQSQQNLSKKIAANNFKLSEYQRLVEALGCTLEINIVLPNGDKL
jgi:transcriptional regulator with XRE-family HTH domain